MNKYIITVSSLVKDMNNAIDAVNKSVDIPVMMRPIAIAAIIRQATMKIRGEVVLCPSKQRELFERELNE